MEHASALLEQVPRQPDLGAPGFWQDFLLGMLKPVAATAVVAMAVALSFAQRLGLEREMLYSVARAFLQLSVVGFVLHFIFTQKNAPWILLAYLFMVTVAGYTAGQRAKHVPRGKYIACVSILVGTAITMLVLVVLKVFPFTPRYIIPLAGMLVGCAMTNTGVTMKKLREDVKVQRNMVETALALGATPREATLQQVRRSLGIALAPVIDNAKTVGLIALPGAMTGLIMGGASPLEAIQLQIVVKNMVMAANTPVAATAVFAIAVALSFTQAPGLEREMLCAVARAFVQLPAMGFVLQFIFTQKHNAPWILLGYFFMRAKHVPGGKYIAGVSILVGTATTLSLLVALNIFPFTPRYIVPVASMMVGNAMTVTGVTMKKLREDVKMQRNLVETALALGATPRQATLQQVRRSLGIALSPVIDSAKTVGLISLPGTMTGLIMAGVSPLEAIQLQLVVKNMTVASATVSSLVCSYLCWPAFFTKAFQLKDQVFADK
ncbi:UPF0014 membrane protein STAR2 [Dichanthelium oligosanthes]|uniref:UPF0014 membrane protein STAR2 n=1 Tax=Dichanthelium oligosanthes TaxID=888268 RepID=A0A1E5VDV1_9POAL|nr:UPF0014 membrane protein STAR2 [Dichanthelium oligosanthes]